MEGVVVKFECSDETDDFFTFINVFTTDDIGIKQTNRTNKQDSGINKEYVNKFKETKYHNSSNNITSLSSATKTNKNREKKIA